MSALKTRIGKLLALHRSRMVFYFDAEASWTNEFAEIDELKLVLLRVDKNYFELKYKIEKELADQKLFIYHPFKKPEGAALHQYPLLDLLHANVELKLDAASDFIADFAIKPSHIDLVRRYIKLLKTKRTQKKLAKILEPNSFSPESLKMALVAHILNAPSITDRNLIMARMLIVATRPDILESNLNELKLYDLDNEIVHWFNVLLGTEEVELNRESIERFARIIKYNTLSLPIEKVAKEDTYAKLKLKRLSDQNKLRAFMDDWEKETSFSGSIDEVFSTVAREIEASKLLAWYGLEQDFGYYSEQMLTSILAELYKKTVISPNKSQEESYSWSREKTLVPEIRQQFIFIYHTSKMFSLLKDLGEIDCSLPKEFVDQYVKNWQAIDFNYRKAVLAFDSCRDRLDHLEAGAIQVFDQLNKRYDRYLIELNVAWQQSLEKLDFNYSDIKVNKQYEFYENHIATFEHKMVVIISDAMRFELGYELHNDLLADGKNQVNLDYALASIPSYTNLGMSNLLPHKGMELEKGDQDIVLKINGKATVSGNREAILQAANKESKTIDYSQVMKFDVGEGRSYFNSSKIVYIYHDWIDAIGDKRRTEHQTFDATGKAIDDIKRLIKKLNNWNVYYVMVTSDHGFLFNYNDLPEASREAMPKTKGYSRDHVRFVMADSFENDVDGYCFDLKDTTRIDTDLKVAIPRAINRFRKQGNVGLQFVHGGASLQELVTPILKVYKQKKDTSLSVSFKRIDQAEKITSGSIKVLILQETAVSNEFGSIDIILGVYSPTGELYSNEEELQLNATSSNPKERLFEVNLTLNTKGTQSTFGYIKAFDKKDKERLNPLNVNDVVKINVLIDKDF